MVAGLLTLGLLLPAPVAFAAGARVEPHRLTIAQPPAEAVRLHSTHIARVQPSVRAWIAEEAKKAKQAAPGAVTEASLGGQVRARFSGQTMGANDVMALIARVLTDAASQAAEDLRTLAEEQKANLEAKKKLRELQEKVRQQLAGAAGKPGAERCVAPACGGLGLAVANAALRQSSARASLTAKEPTKLGDLKALDDELKAKIDLLNELSEELSLRLQMMMDRYAKFLAALSNILKKYSETAQSIVQNLK